MTTTQISTKDNRTPIYYIGLVREGRKLIIQAKESVDELSCEITDYLGPRQVSKATIEANKTILLEGFKADPKYRNCDMVEVQEPEEVYTRPEVTKFKQIAYLEQMQKKMMDLNQSMHDLNMLWQKDMQFDLDMNDYLANQYPFNFSFDDLVIEADVWYQKGWVALNQKIKVLQGYPADKVYGTQNNEQKVEEPSAPYYTPEEAQGKWICAYDTMCGGWDCVRYSGGDKDGYPVLYGSKREVEADDFFDGEDDFAILATEFIEGRKAFFGANGLHIEGIPIVKGYRIKGNKTTMRAEEPEAKYEIKVAKAWQSSEFFPNGLDIIALELDYRDRIKLLGAIEKCKLYGYDHIAVHAGRGAEYLTNEGDEVEFYTDVEYFKVFNDCVYFYAQSKYDSGCQVESERIVITNNLAIELPDHVEYEVEQQ